MLYHIPDRYFPTYSIFADNKLLLCIYLFWYKNKLILFIPANFTIAIFIYGSKIFLYVIQVDVSSPKNWTFVKILKNKQKKY